MIDDRRSKTVPVFAVAFAAAAWLLAKFGDMLWTNGHWTVRLAPWLLGALLLLRAWRRAVARELDAGAAHEVRPSARGPGD